MKKIFEMKKNENGFTLIELIIVIAILAIIAAVAVPNIIGAVDNSRKSADVANAKIILNAAAQVTAKTTDDPVSAAGIAYYVIDEAGVAEVNGTANASANFATQMGVELNNASLVPKFQGAGTAENFLLIVTEDANGVTTMEVAVSTDAATTTTVNLLAPNAAAAYDQN